MTFAFYLCNPCSETWGELAGTYTEPDAIFWKRVQEEQLEKHKRLLTPEEMIEELKDGSNSLSRLAKDRLADLRRGN